MTIIKPSVEIIEEKDVYKRIEIAARTCYKSEDKITDDSAKKMVAALIKRGHESPLEHSILTVVCHDHDASLKLKSCINGYRIQTRIPDFVKLSFDNDGCVRTVSANIRAWRSICKFVGSDPLLISLFAYAYADLFSDIYNYPVASETVNKYAGVFSVFANTGFSDANDIITARFICDRGVSHELVRHRLGSYSQESTRYVNYKDGLTFIEPWWWPEQETSDTQLIRTCCQTAEDTYKSLILSGSSPQKARAILPNMLKTEVVATGTVEYWKKYVLPLRLSKAAHPDMRRIITLFCEQLGWDPAEFGG